MYLDRTLRKCIKQVSSSFPVLLVTGPRQVGKTTLLEACSESKRNYVTLDDFDERELARNDPALFLQEHKAPLIIDEVQYAPQLFSAIKLEVDRSKKPGSYWLTGSQKFHLMKEVSDSLAGRIAIVDLLGFSGAELNGHAAASLPFLPTNPMQGSSKDLMDVYRDIWVGSFPKMVLEKGVNRDIFYKSYIETYIQRDVRDLARVGDERAFHYFLRAIAARSGQLLNLSEVGRDVDINSKTAKSWLSILEASGLVYLLQPYHTNVTKRLIKTPKLFFIDTGLCAYLTQWSTPEALEAGAMSGAILETYIFAEILKSYWHNGKEPNFYFYRDRDGREIDLLIEQNNQLFPVEFKKTATPSKNAMKHFHILKTLNREIGHGAVICLKKEKVALSSEVDSIPISFLF